MRIALVDANKGHLFYPLPLLKLGAWQKTKGNRVQLFDNKLPKKGRFDEIWISTIFTYHLKHSLSLAEEAKKRARKVVVGGVAASIMPNYFEQIGGLSIHRGLHSEAEKHRPDFSLLSERTNYAITHASRGCIRKCGFCAVRIIEPKFIRRSNWEKDLPDNPIKSLLFYDNNWLALPVENIKQDIKKILGLRKDKKIREVDFNQGLDARLLTDELADLLGQVKFSPLRFAFDNMSQDGAFQTAIEKMAERGQRDFRNYILYNYLDTPKDFYYRLRECARLSEELKISCDAFPMRYQPVDQPDPHRSYVGKNWTLQKRNAVQRIISNAGTRSGVVACCGGYFKPFQEFEYWFGKDDKEFEHLLNYDRIGELLKRKKGKLRMMRAGE